MQKHAKKIIAVVLVLTMAVSVFVINSSAAAEESRVTEAIAGVVDGIETSGDVEDELGVDVGTIIDVVKDMSKADVNTDDLAGKITEILPGDDDDIDIEDVAEDIADAVAGSSDNAGAVDVSDLTALIGGFDDSDLGEAILTKAIEAVVGSLDLGETGSAKATEVLTLLIANIKGGNIELGTTDVDSDIDDNWIGTWSTSMVEGNFKLSGSDANLSLKNVTARTRLMSSREGDTVRITLSNLYGKSDLKIGEITIGIANTKVDRAVELDSLKKVTVGGSEAFTIPAGQIVKTDPIDFEVEACQEIMISIFYKDVNTFSTIGLINGHCYAGLGNQTEKYVTPADVDLAAENLSVGAYEVLPTISNVDVYDEDPDAYSLVVFGDSTTTNTTVKKISAMLKANGIDNVGVLLQGIKGNEVLLDGQGSIGNIMGKAATTRFANDVLNQPGVKKVLIKVGVNDLAHPACASKVAEYPNFDREVQVANIEAAYDSMIDAAHAQGLDVYFATRTPCKGYTRNILGLTGDDISQESWETIIEPGRTEINTWLKEQVGAGRFEGLVDLDFLMDPDNYGALCPDYTLDGVHFTDLGCQLFAKTAYPVIFGDSQADLDDIDLSNTGSYGGIDNDLNPLFEKIRTIFGTNNGDFSKIDLTQLTKIFALIKNGSASDINIDTIKDLISQANPDAKPSTDILSTIKDLIAKAGNGGETGNEELDLSTLIKVLSGVIGKDNTSGLDTDAILALLDELRGKNDTPTTDEPTVPATSDIDFSALLGLLDKIQNGSADGTEINLDQLKDIVGNINPDNTVDNDLLNKVLDVINSKTSVYGAEASKEEAPALDTDTLKDLFTKLGVTNVDDSAITGILDKVNAGSEGSQISLPDLGSDNSQVTDWIESILGGINGGSDAVPGTTNEETKTPVVVDPALKVDTEETLEDVDIINDSILADDSTPLAAVPVSDDTLLDSEVIANTGDAGMIAGVAITVVAAAAFVSNRKKKEY